MIRRATRAIFGSTNLELKEINEKVATLTRQQLKEADASLLG